MELIKAESAAQDRRGNYLGAYRRKIYSQDGEDGVLEKILSFLPVSDRWCVEFGAWDGVLGSNTHFLIKEKGWSGVLIEGNKVRCADLRRNYVDIDRAVCVERMVDFEGENSLDAILEKTPIPKDFDLASIDVDGVDYHVWASISQYKPKVVLIEFNGTIPDTVSYVQPRDFSVSHGSSLLAMCELGRSKGYELIALVGMNAFFVDAKYYSLFGLSDNSLDSMNAENRERCMTQIYQLYDGTFVTTGCLDVIWHGIRLTPLSLQPLPAIFRFCPNAPVPWYKSQLFRFYRLGLKVVNRLRRSRGI